MRHARRSPVIFTTPPAADAEGKTGRFARVLRAMFGARKRTVEEALALPPAAYEPRVFSHVLVEHRGKDGKLKSRKETGWVHNLTTDTASGYTNRRDWQAKAMGGGLSPVATMTGTATASGATSLTNSGASFPTAGQGLAGMIVVVGPNASGTGAISFACIVSNTGTVLTVDRWYSGGTWGAGTTPNATGLYTVIPGQMPAMFIGITADATAPTSADTTLASELAANGFTRALATWAHTAAATTYTLTNTFTCSGGSTTINVEAEFAAANVTAGGAMPFKSAVPSPPTMVSGDTLAITATITIN